MKIDQRWRIASLVAICLEITACGGGGGSGGGSSTPPPLFTLGGTISGLGSAGLVLRNGEQSVSPAAGASSFVFSQALSAGSPYLVEVGQAPDGMSCIATNAMGTMPSANVANVDIRCAYILGGTLSGLDAPGLVLANGDDVVSPDANAADFRFERGVALDKPYDVVVEVQPVGLHCEVTGGSGVMDENGALSAVSVHCSSVESIVHSFDANTWPGASLTLGSDGNLYGVTSNGGSNSGGMVFRLTPAGAITELHSFGPQIHGWSPFCGVVEGNDGKLYGMTAYGGANDEGTAFSVDQNGVHSVVYAFGASMSDARMPSGCLIQGSDGNLYGMTQYGGSHDKGALFRLTTAGTLTVLYSFGDTADDGAYPMNTLVEGSDGNFYGMTAGGGLLNRGTVFSITPAGVLTILHRFTGSANDGELPHGHLIEASDGDFYGTTTLGGASSAGTVFKITPSGEHVTLYSFGGIYGNGGFPQGGLIENDDGSFYGLTTSDAVHAGMVFRILPDGSITTLYNFGSKPNDAVSPLGTLTRGPDDHLYGITTNGGANSGGAVFKVRPR